MFRSFKVSRSFFYRRNFCSDIKTSYDAVVVGGGHNGLIAAAYLARSGLSVCVLERRHLIGGAAVTEELIPGFKFSRASYVLSLLRPQIYRDLDLKRHGLKIHIRDPGSYTPLRNPTANGTTSLLLGNDVSKNAAAIAKFSKADAENFAVYNAVLEKIASGVEPLLDNPPIFLNGLSNWRALKEQRAAISALIGTVRRIGTSLDDFIQLMTAPAEKFLRRWLESEPLLATLATDAIIGANQSPRTPGSGYCLLHHVMGGVENIPGAWGYVEGGMGALSECLAAAAREKGAHIFTNKEVTNFGSDSQGRVNEVVLKDGTSIRAKVVLSNATARVTFEQLLPSTVSLPSEIKAQLKVFDYTSPVTKINVAVSRIPTFLADPTPGVQPWHQCTIHMNSETCDDVHQAYLDAQSGHWSQKPIIEMTIPSALDRTLSPPGAHVVQLFTQFTPFHLFGKEWTDEDRTTYKNLVFDAIEEYSPGFKESVIGVDFLAPPDLEKVFGLTGGNIFHGAITVDQIYLSRPAPRLSSYRSCVPGLYLCGSSTHPGGGVMGSAGRLAAECVLKDLKRQWN